jgi:putative salt-induced outer membrane protein YdiY
VRKIFTVLIISIFIPVLLLGADPIDGRISLGYIDTSGNTDDQKLNFDFNVSQKRSEQLKMQYNGLYHYGKSSGKTNTDKKKLNTLAEFIQNQKNSMYAKLGLLQDEFAGYDFQTTLGLGLLTKLREGKVYNFKGKAGFEFTKDEYTDSTSKNVEWLSLGLIGDRKISENIKLKSSLDWNSPFDGYEKKYHIDFNIGGVFTVNTKIDLEMKYTTQFRKEPAVAGKEKTDSTFLTSLVYKL